MECIRKVRHIHSGYVLTVWDTYQTTKDHRSVLRYDFRSQNDTEPLFSGSDYFPGQFTSTDSDESILCLLAFLTLRPGDTDREYFAEYSEKQLNWANSSKCENMQCDIAILENEEPEKFGEIFEELEF